MQRTTPRPHNTARRMARTLHETTAATGACTDDDLRRAGFTLTDIAEHGDAARDLAARMNGAAAA